MFQVPGDRPVDGKDHVWVPLRKGRWTWKCCLCGAVTTALFPPEYPTRAHWMPERYEGLNESERAAKITYKLGA